jgi:hypothetical protein
MFRAYFADHETYSKIGKDELQVIVDERAHACALRYQQKLRHLHLSQTDYCLDTTVQRLESVTLTRSSIINTIIDDTYQEENNQQILTISVV